MTSDASGILITTEDGIIVARGQSAQMGEAEAQELRVEVLAAAERSAALPVVVDLTPVSMIPSLCIGSLVALWQQFSRTNRRFILTGLQPRVRETLTLCRLDKLFEICDTLDEAKDRLAQR